MEKYDVLGETEEGKEKGIYINGIKYSYIINKSKNEKEEILIIKLYVPNQKSKSYFIFEAPEQKIRKEIKFLDLCDNLNEMIISLKEIFSLGNAKAELKGENCNLQLKYIVSGISKKCQIKLTKYESNESNNSLEDIIVQMRKQNNYLLNKYEGLKEDIKKIKLRNIIKKNNFIIQ